MPGARRRGRRAVAPRRARAERAPGDVRLGRDPRAAHPADDLPPLHRDARRGDGRRRRRAARVLQDASRRGRPARPPGRERPGLRPARARPRGRRAARSSRPPSCSTAWSPGSPLRAQQAGMELIVGPVETPRRACAWTSRWSIRSSRTWSTTRSSTRASASDRRIHLDVAPAGRWLTLTVRDHGPGLLPAGDPPAVPAVLEVGPRRRAVRARASAWASP